MAFLPLHAAGIYTTTERGSKLSDFVVSSYIPTLSTLLRDGDSSVPFRLLAVAQPNTPNASMLPNTTEELIRIRRFAGDLPLISLEGAEATIGRVIDSMGKCSWIHLACHAAQDACNPAKSALLLDDGNLHLSEIIKYPLPHAQFAFLSACQTAAGDKQLPDEGAHLAAGMLFAGYSGVVATMWPIQDDDAPKVAESFYSQILKDKQPDHVHAAHALHYTIQRLREEGAPLMSWVPFIHNGM
jgi:CHAT domain-containing protein